MRGIGSLTRKPLCPQALTGFIGHVRNILTPKWEIYCHRRGEALLKIAVIEGGRTDTIALPASRPSGRSFIRRRLNEMPRLFA